MLESSEMNFEERMVSPKKTENETDDFEVTLRPKTLSEYIGQDKIKENLSIFIEAAKKRSEPFIRSSGTWQNYPFGYHCARNGRKYPCHLGSCH